MKMIDYSLINTNPADESNRRFAYEVLEITMNHYVNELPDWDENERRKYHEEIWQSKRPKIIMYNNKPIGTIYIAENRNHTEIAQFYILPEYQNKGIGSHILEGILDNSDKAGSTVELEVLKVNPAVSLYKRYGFQVVSSNEYIYQMERKPDSIT